MIDRDFTAQSQSIGDAFFASAPEGWVSGDLHFRQVGKTGEFGRTATLADGTEVRFRMPSSIVRTFREMRTLMAQPGKGAWFTARCHIEASGRITFDFDYDNEPSWSTPTSVGHYLEEWEKHPRDPEHTPPWLAQRLQEAHEWDAQTR